MKVEQDRDLGGAYMTTHALSTKEHVGRRRWRYLVMLLLLVLAVPAICRYQSPLVGVSGYKTQLVTGLLVLASAAALDYLLFRLQLHANSAFEMQPHIWTLSSVNFVVAVILLAIAWLNDRVLP